MYSFDYHRPAALADAAALLGAKDDPKLMAGGMTLIPTLKQRLAQPSDVIDLGGIAQLQGITEESGGLTIGAMTTHAQVQFSDIVRRVIPALAALAGDIGDAQVRNRGTIGGSVANADPAADYPAGLLGLNAVVRTNRREIPADAFFTGLFETALQPGEIITAVHFPQPDRAAYAKFPNPASRYAVVGVFVAKTGGAVRVAVTGAAGHAHRWTAAEQALTANFTPAALDGLTVPHDTLNSDIHASADYRAHLVGVMAKRAVMGA